MSLIIPILFLLSPLSIFAQINIINRSLTDSSLNIAYVGVENEIELMGYKGSDKISFSTTNGTLMNLSENQYVLRPSKEEQECVVSFFDRGKKIASKTFKIESFSVPIKRFGRLYDSIAKDGHTIFITYDNLMKDPALRITITNCYYKVPWKIVSYRITLDSLSGNGTMTEFVVASAEPTKEQIQMIKNYGANTFMTIEDIRVAGPDGRTRILVPMILIIK